MANLPDAHKQQLLTLRSQQLDYKRQIDQEVARLVGAGPQYSRYFFTHFPEKAAMECLRHVVNQRLTRPQMKRLLLAIKTALPGKSYEAGSGVTIDFTSRNFTLTLVK